MEPESNPLPPSENNDAVDAHGADVAAPRPAPRELRHVRRAVEAALRAWDPLETKPGVEGPPDEYDGYAPPLVELVLGGADVERVTCELAQLRRLLLAERDDPAADARIAALIVAALHEPAPAHDEPRRPRKQRRAARDEGSYVCPSCSEEIVVPLDASEGAEQTYVEDCPVCCHANVIHVEFGEGGEPARVSAQAE
jgi:hypothetical protein